MINWSEFTPWSSLLGGILIGVATSILLLINGKIAGISGILGEALSAKKQELGWRLAFIIGLILAPLIYALFHPLPIAATQGGWSTIIIAGLLVGFGTRYGSGCTSGHGICGISRLSLRSITATIIFMLSAALVVYLTHHLFIKI